MSSRDHNHIHFYGSPSQRDLTNMFVNRHYLKKFDCRFECVNINSKLIGSATTIKSSKEIVYPSITVCTPKASTPLEYPPALNESLVSIKYRFPNGSVQVVSPIQTMWMPDVENRTKTYAHNCLWKYEDDASVGVLYLTFMI